MSFFVSPQDFVDSLLVTVALSPEPGKDVGVQVEDQLLLG